MNIKQYFLLAFLVYIFAYVLTLGLRRYAISQRLIDIPNERSSHDRPTPRGGGLSISVAVISSMLVYFMIVESTREFTFALVGGGALVTAIGWIDDHKSSSPLIRIIAYTIAAVWAVYWLNNVKWFALGTTYSLRELTLGCLSVIWTVWLINLYNFMDGSDALAAMEAISVALFGVAFFYFSGQQQLLILCIVLVFSSVGFLMWNWPPAKIFMGDVGSCLIGYTLAIISLYGQITGSVPLSVWAILMAVFICDASYTLLYRIFTGEVWYAAHRSHAYQRLIQMGLSHKNLALAVSGLNIFILWPSAYIALSFSEYRIIILFSIYTLFGIFWYLIQARYQYKTKNT